MADSYKPIFWSRNIDGKWDMKTKKEMPNVELCEMSARFTRRIVNIGEVDDYFTLKPIGHDLKTVPLNANPSKAKVGEYFTFQVLYKGQPQKGVKISGLPAYYHHDEEVKAFSTVTDKDGQFDFKPLKGGPWLLKATLGLPCSDKAACDIDYYEAFLPFDIAE